jgi:carboxyl-terminal processing protease
LDAIFTSFSTAKITNIIVDLRYNGGGYVETAEYVANLIAPGSLLARLFWRYATGC